MIVFYPFTLKETIPTKRRRESFGLVPWLMIIVILNEPSNSRHTIPQHTTTRSVSYAQQHSRIYHCTLGRSLGFAFMRGVFFRFSIFSPTFYCSAREEVIPRIRCGAVGVFYCVQFTRGGCVLRGRRICMRDVYMNFGVRCMCKIDGRMD
jgi:hypothetical protein